MKILICGHRAFAAKGLVGLLKSKGHDVFCFSRGKGGGEGIEGNAVFGRVDQIDKNQYLNEHFDVVVNFILLKDDTFENNLAYIEALCRFCKEKNVGKLIHLSSISSYPNDASTIDEDTDIDHKYQLKGGYGALKVLVDEYLIKQRDEEKLPVVFVRPGFIMAEDHPSPLGGILKLLPGDIGILMGDKKCSLSVVTRDEMQYGLVKIIEDVNPLNVYLLLRSGNHTKLEYAKSKTNAKIITLPKKLVIMTACILKSIHIIDDRIYQMVRGQFKVQTFNADKTYYKIEKFL